MDQLENVWLGTEDGLYIYNQKNKHLNYLKITEGKLSNRFTEGSSQGKDGTLYFGSQNGFFRFYPEKINLNQPIPKVFFTKIQTANEVLSNEVLYGINHLSLIHI